MEHSKPSEVINQQMNRIQAWLNSSDLKHWFRRLWPDTASEGSSGPVAPRETLSSMSEWEEPRTLRSGSGPTQAELERLENGRPSSHSIVFLNDSDLDDIFEPTVQEEARINYEDPSVSAAPSTIGDELAARMLRSATGNDPEAHH